MTTQTTLFNSVMTDITGTVRLESEDPRWIQLFLIKNLSSLLKENDNLAVYFERFMENNLESGNLVQLLEQTCSRVKQITTKKSAPNGQSIDQCCMALHLCSSLMHCLVSSLTPNQVK